MTVSASTVSSKSRTEIELGMLLMTLAMLVVPLMDVLAKWLSATIAPGQVAWGRFFFQTLLLLPIMLVTRRPIRTPQLRLHILRGALIAIATLLFFWAIKYLPVANAIAIFFIEPLLLTLLSALFLGETIGIRRLGAVVIGLVGALIVIRPNWQSFGWAAVLPLGTAFCFAGYLALTRHAAKEDAFTTQLWGGGFAAIILSLGLVAGSASGIDVLTFRLPALGIWSILLAVGAIAAISHVLIAAAFRKAPAGILAPFQYLEIISATAFGYIFFGDFPDILTWLGTAIIVGAGCYVFFRERQLSRQA